MYNILDITLLMCRNYLPPLVFNLMCNFAIPCFTMSVTLIIIIMSYNALYSILCYIQSSVTDQNV